MTFVGKVFRRWIMNLRIDLTKEQTIIKIMKLITINKETKFLNQHNNFKKSKKKNKENRIKNQLRMRFK